MAPEPHRATPPAGREFRGLAALFGARLFDDVLRELHGDAALREAESDPVLALARERLTRTHRFVTDLGGVEQALEEVARVAAERGPEPTLAARAWRGTTTWRRARLRPLAALRLVPLAWRLLPWSSRRRGGPAFRSLWLRQGLRHLVVYCRPGARASYGPPPVGWLSLDAGEGRLLELVLQGGPLGEAVDRAAARGWVPDAARGRALLDAWVDRGLFAGTGRAAS